MIRPRLIILALLSVLLLSATGVYAQAPTPQGTPLGSGFTYQGQLKKGGQPYTGTCAFQFGLYDAANAGIQIGSLLNKGGVNVTNGVFAVQLDFGASAFSGEGRWLQVAVKCSGDTAFVPFSTRQELTPTPYALGLIPGAVIRGNNADSITGVSTNHRGVAGFSETYQGVFGFSRSQAGVVGESNDFYGVFGLSHNSKNAGVYGGNDQGGAGVLGESDSGVGVYGRSANGYAGFFDGKVRVKTLEIAGGADLAEPFDISTAKNTAIIPGTVVCIDPTNPGKLVVCANAYDRTVAGVISGAGGVQPGMVMRQDGSAANGQRPVALTGRVYVWADATQNPIHPGDLLTTSSTPGHAAKASDHDAAQGAIIGKAMGTLESGKGLVLVLVGLN